MAAPVATVRQSPNGIIVPDGYKSLITFARLPDAPFWEKSLTTGGLEGGDEIDISTMHNSKTKTARARKLYKPKKITVKAGYDAKFKNVVRSTLINVETTITETEPDGSTYAYFGYLQDVEFGEKTEGGFPEVTLTIIQTNYDPANHVEAEAVFVEVVGT